MFIPYEKIGQTLKLFFPKYSKEIWEYCYEKKIEKNCKFIENNSKNVIKKLKKQYGSKPIRVAFWCNEKTKWKCQSLYDLMLESSAFHPFIIASKNNAGPNTTSPMTAENVKDTYKFFSEKGLETYYGYDIEKEEFIPIKNFSPDIIFYQQPWNIPTIQGPVVASKFALTYYVPYFIANVSTFIEYGLRFHQYIYKHYILNNAILKFYSPEMRNEGQNLCVVGHPQLDYFYLTNHKEKEKKYVIYAPHWSINNPQEGYATFEWNGQYILDFAKKHPEIKWIFKPHPALKRRLETQKIMTTKEIEMYWNEWEKIGLKYESGDYLDLFAESYAMITDCGSFLTEYFLTEQPLIHLISEKCVGYNPSASAVIENYYKAHNIEELEILLNNIVLNKNDSMKENRIKSIESLGFKNVYAGKNILDDIKKDLGAK